MGVPLAEAPAQPARSTLRVALGGYENNITPFTLTFRSQPNHHELLMMVYDSLFWSQASLDPEPWLAETAVASADRRSWTVTLRPGILWHDGSPLTSEDVQFTFEYFLKQGRNTPRYAHHAFDAPSFVGARVVDRRTVVLSFDRPAPTFKILPGGDLPIVPKHVWQDVVEPNRATDVHPIGSGPFAVAEIVPGEGYRLKANPDYFMGRPTLDEMDLRVIGDRAETLDALRMGLVDLVIGPLKAGEAESLAREPGVSLESGKRLLSTQLYFNARKSPLTDARVRKALSLAIDNGVLTASVLGGSGRPGVDSFLHPESPWALPDADHEFDPVQAEALLDEAGYTTIAADGIRSNAEGERLDFSILIYASEPDEKAAAQLLGSQLQAVGVRVAPQLVDEVTLSKEIQVPYGEVGAFDMYIGSEETHIHVDPDSLYYMFHSPGRNGFGYRVTGYGSARFDGLAERARTSEIGARRGLMHEMQRIIAAEAPLVVLWYGRDVAAYRPAAYARWTSDFGHSIFTKRSFLPSTGALRVSPAEGDVGGETGELAWLAAGGVILLGFVGVFVLLRRRVHRDSPGVPPGPSWSAPGEEP